MDTSKYWAKSDKVTTLVIHNAALREALDKLYELGYIEKEMYELLKIACEYHDLGKINEMFQARMKNKKLHFDLEKEIPHNVLSLFFVDSERVNKINPEDKKNYVRMLFAILYHHYNSDLMRMVSSSKRQLENIFPQDAFPDIQDEIYSLPIGIEEEISEVIGLKDEKAVKMKGLLHKCDYAASGHYPIEFMAALMTSVRGIILQIRKNRRYNRQRSLHCLNRIKMKGRLLIGILYSIFARKNKIKISLWLPRLEWERQKLAFFG